MRSVQLSIRTAEIYTCVFAPDGTRYLTGSEGNAVALWDLTSCSCMHNFEHDGPVWALAWSSDHRLFLSLDGTMRMWEVDTGKCLRVFKGCHVRCVAWSADHKWALSASNGALQLTDLESGQFLRKLKGHSDGVYCAAFDLNYHRALSGSRDRTVRVWDLETGRCTGVFKGHTYHVHAVAWWGDQRHAISCSRDIRLWEVETGQCLCVFSGHGGRNDTIRSINLSAD